MTDVLAALVALLQADPAIAAITQGRVYAGELPAEQAAEMPRPALVLQPQPGAAAVTAQAALRTQRVDLVCWGKTPGAAFELHRVAAAYLRQLSRSVAAGCLVHCIEDAGGFTAERDGNSGWPYSAQSFTALFSTEPVPE